MSGADRTTEVTPTGRYEVARYVHLVDTKFTNRSSFVSWAGTAMPRSHRGTGISPGNDWAHSL